MLKKNIMAFMLLGAITSAPAMAQVSKKIMIGVGIAIGASSAASTVGTMSANSEDGTETGESRSGESNSDASDSGQSDSNSNSKANLVQLEENYYSYLQDFKLADSEGRAFTLEDIEQPYIKEIIINILKNEELVAQINEEVEGVSLLDKINKVLAQELSTLLD